MSEIVTPLAIFAAMRETRGRFHRLGGQKSAAQAAA
jgi:hypothetical protein